MDHIPKPLSPGLPPIEVPYLGFPYDRLGFHGFLERNNLSTERVCKGDFGTRSDAEAAGILQAWLFFSVLDEVVSNGIEGRPIRFGARSQVDPNDFIRESDGKFWITTAKLPALLGVWRNATLAISQIVKKHSAKVVEGDLQMMHKLAFNCFHPRGHLYGKWPLDDTAIFSMIVLYETLGDFAVTVYKNDIDTALCLWPESVLITKRLQSAGWSDIDIKTWDRGPGPSYFLSSLLWPRLDGNRTQESQVVSRGRETNTERLHTRHTTPECDCGFLSVNRDEIASIVLQGRVPLVKVRLICDSECVRPTLEVTSWDMERVEKIPYVAISHVWIDGLGNRWENALPQCQLLKLMRMTASIYTEEATPPYFWLDTLCIPCDAQAKKLALPTMKQVYERASKTLVLDASLMQIQWNGRLQAKRRKQSNYFYGRALEFFARLITSAWFQRLWTVQEAAYSKEIHVQLADGTARPDIEAAHIAKQEMPSEMGGQEPGFVGFGIGISIVITYLSVHCGVQDPHEDDAVRLTTLCEILHSRYTTNWEDEAICVATLLGLDVAVVQSLAPRDRIGAILKNFAQIPSRMVFRVSSRYSTDGLRWAPTSLLHLMRYESSSEGPSSIGTLSDRGLTIETIGLITCLDAWKKNIILLGRTKHHPQMWLCVTAYGNTGIFSDIWDQLGGRINPLRTADERDAVCEGVKQELLSQLHDGCEELGFLLEPVWAQHIDLRESNMKGLLVEIVERAPSDAVITGRVLSRLQVGVSYKLPFTELISKETYLMEASEPDQKWCLM